MFSTCSACSIYQCHPSQRGFRASWAGAGSPSQAAMAAVTVSVSGTCSAPRAARHGAAGGTTFDLDAGAPSRRAPWCHHCTGVQKGSTHVMLHLLPHLPVHCYRLPGQGFQVQLAAPPVSALPPCGRRPTTRLQQWLAAGRTTSKGPWADQAIATTKRSGCRSWVKTEPSWRWGMAHMHMSHHRFVLAGNPGLPRKKAQ